MNVVRENLPSGYQNLAMHHYHHQHHQQQQQQQQHEHDDPYYPPESANPNTAYYPYPDPNMNMNMNMPPPQFPMLNPIPQPVSGKRRRAEFEGTTPTPISSSSYDYNYSYYYCYNNNNNNNNSSSAPYEFEGGDDLKRANKAQDVIFRIVVPSKQIGKVIGKEGSRIQKIREATKATIKIADAIARHEERVIIISSKERENAVSDAENALQQIATLILKEDESCLEAAKLVGAAHVAANTIRLLIAGTQAGSLIGVSGQNIEKLRDSSGATITVLAPNQLPLCASALESDRVVQISGDVPAVMKALEEIGFQLRENPPRQVISISPAYNYCTVRPTHTFVDPTSVDYVTLEMMISETLVGGLIGRCGSNISRIRSESGAMIKVHGGKGAQKHRQIQFGGSAQQVALAKQRVDEYIYSQLIQKEDSDQGVDK